MIKKTQKSTSKNHLKQFSATFLVVCMVYLMSISLVMSLEFDNTKSYDAEKREITITNAFGLGDDIAYIKLNTEQHRYIILGEYAFEIEINNVDTYSNWLKEMELYQKENPYTMLGKRITGKSFIYKYWDGDYKYNETIEVLDCVKIVDNQTLCEPNYQKKERQGAWLNLNEQSELPKGIITIRGYYPNLKEGETIEWIPTLFGVRIYEWADFTGLTKFEWLEIVGTTDGGIGNDAWRGQTFTVGTVGSDETFDATGISILGKDTNNCDNVTFTIQGVDGSSHPNGTFFSIGYDNVTTWGVDANEWHNISMNSIHNLSASTQYAIVVNASKPSDCMKWRYFTTDGNEYTGGDFVFGADGVNWDINARDFIFKVWGGIPSITGDLTMTITHPTNDTFLQTTMDFNVTVVNGTNAIDQCWYTLTSGVTNITLSNDTATNFFATNSSIASGGYKSDFFCNDSGSAVVNESVSFELDNIRIDSEVFNNETREGSTETFELNVTLASGLQVSTAIFTYNNTDFTGSFTSVGQSYSITRVLSIPFVSTETNNSFNWNVTLDDKSSLVTNKKNQSVLNFNIDNCTSYGILLLNYSLRDEEDQTLLGETDTTNSSVEVDININPIGSTTSIINFSSTYPLTNNPQVCLDIDLGNATFEMFVTTRYGASDYAKELHHIQNFTLVNSSLPQNIILFDLLSDDATSFLITFRDKDFILVEDALIDIQRNYVGEGTFKSIEIPKTDANGQAVASFDLKTVIYTIIVSKNGELLATFDNIAVICQDVIIGRCEINLNALATTTGFPDWETLGDITHSFSFDPDGRVITLTFTTADGSTKLVLLNTTKYDRFGNDTICTDSLTSSSGTLTCNIPNSFGNVTMISQLFADGRFITQRVFRIIPSPEDIFGVGTAGVLALILVITIPLMLTGSAIAIIIGIIVGLIIASILTLYQGGTMFGVTSSILWIIIAGGILIWKISQRGN